MWDVAARHSESFALSLAALSLLHRAPLFVDVESKTAHPSPSPSVQRRLASPRLAAPRRPSQVDVSEGSEDKEEVVALQMLLNAVFTTSLKVDGVVGKATADAIKAAQTAAALPEDGVAGPKTKAALLLASAALSAAPQADERYKEVVQGLLVAAKAQPVRWTLRRDDEPGDEGRDEWMDAALVELERAFVAWSKACRPSSLALESLPTISFEYTAEEADAHILLSFAELATAHEARDGPGGKLAQTTVRVASHVSTSAREQHTPLAHSLDWPTAPLLRLPPPLAASPLAPLPCPSRPPTGGLGRLVPSGAHRL